MSGYTPRGASPSRRATSPYSGNKNYNSRSNPGVLNASAIPREDESGLFGGTANPATTGGGHYDPNASSSNALQVYPGNGTSVQIPRGSDLRAMLVSTERELADLRESAAYESRRLTL